jgi:lipopolysaccharide transport system ATP-binding protein
MANESQSFSKGIVSSEFRIPGDFLNDGSYFISLMVVQDGLKPLFVFDEALQFDIHDFRENSEYLGKWPGAIRPMHLKVKSWQKELAE